MVEVVDKDEEVVDTDSAAAVGEEADHDDVAHVADGEHDEVEEGAVFPVEDDDVHNRIDHLEPVGYTSYGTAVAEAEAAVEAEAPGTNTLHTAVVVAAAVGVDHNTLHTQFALVVAEEPAPEVDNLHNHTAAAAEEQAQDHTLVAAEVVAAEVAEAVAAESNTHHHTPAVPDPAADEDEDDDVLHYSTADQQTSVPHPHHYQKKIQYKEEHHNAVDHQQE